MQTRRQSCSLLADPSSEGRRRPFHGHSPGHFWITDNGDYVKLNSDYCIRCKVTPPPLLQWAAPRLDDVESLLTCRNSHLVGLRPLQTADLGQTDLAGGGRHEALTRGFAGILH